VQGLRRKGLIDALTRLALAWCFSRQLYSTSLTVEENVGFSLYQRSNLPRSRIQELVNHKLEMVGLAGLANATQPSCRVECVRVIFCKYV